MNENKWDGLWPEGNKNDTWSMKCGLKEMRWNMNNEVWTERNEIKDEQWSVDWMKWDVNIGCNCNFI